MVNVDILACSAYGNNIAAGFDFRSSARALAELSLPNRYGADRLDGSRHWVTPRAGPLFASVFSTSAFRCAGVLHSSILNSRVLHSGVPPLDAFRLYRNVDKPELSANVVTTTA